MTPPLSPAAWWAAAGAAAAALPVLVAKGYRESAHNLSERLAVFIDRGRPELQSNSNGIPLPGELGE